MADDPYDLHRFVEAQVGTYDAALAELVAGRKRNHWMWFIFPQARGLGHSPMAHRFGIASLREARAYLCHPVLGPRLVACTDAVMRQSPGTLHGIFGAPDDVKFCSSMTLFDLAEPAGLYSAALARWCEGRADERTIALLA